MHNHHLISLLIISLTLTLWGLGIWLKTCLWITCLWKEWFGSSSGEISCWVHGWNKHMTGLLLSDPWTLHLSQMQGQNNPTTGFVPFLTQCLTQHILDCMIIDMLPSEPHINDCQIRIYSGVLLIFWIMHCIGLSIKVRGNVCLFNRNTGKLLPKHNLFF